MHLRQREPRARQPVGDVTPFGDGRLQELPSRGHAPEEVGHLDARARRRARRLRELTRAGADGPVDLLEAVHALRRLPDA